MEPWSRTRTPALYKLRVEEREIKSREEKEMEQESRRMFLVFYRLEPTFMPDAKLKITDLPRTHRTVALIRANGSEDVFLQMQGEVWSPNGEARELIKGLGLRHTSMSVGDVLYDSVERTFYEVDRIGFRRLMF